MSNHPSSFSEWQNYPSTLDPIHVAWLKNAKKSKTAFAVADIEGIEISHKKFLTGVLLFSQKIKVYSPEQNVGLLLPSSGGGAIASIAILSLGKTLVNLNFTAGKKALQSAAKQAEVKNTKWNNCVSLVTKELKELRRADDYDYELIPVLTNRCY